MNYTVIKICVATSKRPNSTNNGPYISILILWGLKMYYRIRPLYNIFIYIRAKGKSARKDFQHIIIYGPHVLILMARALTSFVRY